MYRELSTEEENEFRQFVDDDIYVQEFLKKASLWHPVIKDEICKRLRNG